MAITTKIDMEPMNYLFQHQRLSHHYTEPQWHWLCYKSCMRTWSNHVSSCYDRWSHNKRIMFDGVIKKVISRHYIWYQVYNNGAKHDDLPLFYEHEFVVLYYKDYLFSVQWIHAMPLLTLSGSNLKYDIALVSYNYPSSSEVTLIN